MRPLIEVLECYKCQSHDLAPRFTNKDSMTAIETYTGKEILKDSQDYKIHFDTLVCLKCGNWDWYTI